MSIHNLAQKIKAMPIYQHRLDILTYSIFIALCCISFWLGKRSVSERELKPVIIAGGIIMNTDANQPSSVETVDATTSARNAPSSLSGGYVASKRGKKYYPVHCAGAKSIKESNRIYFTTDEEALAKGYAQSSQCEYN